MFSRFKSNFFVSFLLLALLVSACQPEVVEVEKEVIVTQVVKEEVEVVKFNLELILFINYVLT